MKTSFLMLVFMFSVVAYLAIEQWGYDVQPREDANQMTKATVLAESWYKIVQEEKERRGIGGNHYTNHSPYASMLGDEYSEITTTLGSIEAKTTGANPEFAALMVKMLDDAGIDAHSTVGVTISGSFPGLAVSTLAALQTIGIDVVLLSSLGASSYGANQPGATWIDIERWLRERGGLRYQSQLVSYGAEGDSGGGISEEGKAYLQAAAVRNGAVLRVPRSFEEAIESRLALFQQRHIQLLVNIGGNQISMGSCVHSTTIPNGYHRSVTSCMEQERGLIVRMTEHGIPFIHLLNIRDLALKNHLPLIPESKDSQALYEGRTARKIPVLLAVFSIGVFLIILRTREQKFPLGK